jgi:ribosomal protein S12 methylthiotransferase
MDVLDVMNERPNICKYLDIPLQHGSTRMLQLMRRGTTREKTEELITEMRARVPDIAIRTTFIVGHPGETTADFRELLDFVEKSRFERAGMFTYSHEENTHSHTMADDVSAATKKKRADELMALQAGISAELNQTKVGKTLKVLVDRMEGGDYFGRTEHDSPEVDNEVIIQSNEHLRIGDFVNVTIDAASEFDLTGSVSGT